MKNLIRSFFAITFFHKIVIITLLGLASCKNDDAIAPDQQPDVASQNLRTSAVPTTLSKLQLTRYGNELISYLPDGRIDEVSSVTRGNQHVYKKYKYTDQSIQISTYANGRFSRFVMCFIDPVTKYCTSVQQGDYTFPNEIPHIETTEFIYKYNAKGQLVNRYNANDITTGTDFIYAPNGDLSSVQNYSAGPGTAGKQVKSGANLYYDQPTGDPILPNLYPINPEEGNFPDPYLRIFGRPGKHLVKLATYIKSQDGRVYSYKTDADGFVTSKDTYKLLGAALVDSKIYNYTMTSFGLGL